MIRTQSAGAAGVGWGGGSGTSPRGRGSWEEQHRGKLASSPVGLVTEGEGKRKEGKDVSQCFEPW